VPKIAIHPKVQGKMPRAMIDEERRHNAYRSATFHAAQKVTNEKLSARCRLHPRHCTKTPNPATIPHDYRMYVQREFLISSAASDSEVLGWPNTRPPRY
jgi:hypothetical protein